MIHVENKENCTGCGACKSVCPVQAIKMQEDEDGFRYPSVNLEKCIRCEKCEHTCPMSQTQNSKKPASVTGVFAAQLKNGDDLRRSSSGGVFWALAMTVFAMDGVVYGAVQTGVDHVIHLRAKTPEEARKMQKSKYLQSDLTDSFEKVRKDLQSKTSVLFSGTPCQIAGLKAFLGKSYDNLLTCEVICHGVPSKSVWQGFIREYEAKRHDNVREVIYRDKGKGWNDNHYRITLESGAVDLCRSADQLFHAGYVQGLYYRPSCGNCKFASLPRVADITLADFWSYHGPLDKELEKRLGLSLIVCNTPIGTKYLNEARRYLYLEESSIQTAVSSCRHLTQSPAHSIDRERFYELFLKDGFYRAADKYVITGALGDIPKRVRRKILKTMRKKNGQ